MIEPVLTYGPIRLLNVPSGQHVYDEVLVADCYRREQVPQGAIVMDVGGFYGEFAIWCAIAKGCHVMMFEPSPACEVARCNIWLNGVNNVMVYNAAVGNRQGDRVLHYRTDHPAGSRLDGIGQNFPCVVQQAKVCMPVSCVTLPEQIKAAKVLWSGPVVVKLDCEGAEQEIFDDESWLDETSLVMLEFHFKDGFKYRSILERHGFTVEPKEYNPETWMDIIIAKKP